MDSLLLSRITKDFLNLDAETPPREQYRMRWSGSILGRAEQLLVLRERMAELFRADPPQATFAPPWYFSRGALEKDRRKNPEPIPYLLTETNERARARPVPHRAPLLRSLCKGKGVLRQNEQGLVYLDIDNRFIAMMLPYLTMAGLVRPPYFNLFGAPNGAHAPVISAREAGFQYLADIEQIGEEFSFEIEGLFSMEPISWPEVEQVWFFQLRSEGLENFRRRHFLPSLPGGHPFHIAVAVKPHVGAADLPRALPLMRINTAFIAA